MSVRSELVYRFTVKAPAGFNDVQRVIWRVQRVLLGNTGAAARRGRHRDRS